jgi:hypothetical protein
MVIDVVNMDALLAGLIADCDLADHHDPLDALADRLGIAMPDCDRPRDMRRRQLALALVADQLAVELAAARAAAGGAS